MSEEITTPIGRLVGGHPMVRRAVMKKGVAVMQADGVTPATDVYIGFAIPKNPGVDWKQEPWGQQIVIAANAGWTGGQSNFPDFSWKVTDGDSAVPNKKNIAPNSREGYPGHWVLHLSTQFAVTCHHVGKYENIEQIQDEKEIKPGDYLRVLLYAKSNDPSESPGVYLNPARFQLNRPGELIVLDSTKSAADAFGGHSAGHPGGPNTTAAPSPGADGPAPAPDFLNGPSADGAAPPPAETVTMYTIPTGQKYTLAQLKAGKWPDDKIAKLPQEQVAG